MNVWLEWAKRKGFRVVAGQAGPLLKRVRDRWQELEDEFSEEGLFARLHKHALHLEPPFMEGWSVLMVAIPAVNYRVTLPFPEGEISLHIPPSFRHFTGLLQEVEDELSALVSPYRVIRLRAPYKSVAAQLGMFRYGKNQVLYDSEWGSYFLLGGYLVKGELTGWEGLQELVFASACHGCEACQKTCPTGALKEGGAMLDYRRCLAYDSEDKTHDGVAHLVPLDRCWLGCLQCQTVCPLNRGCLRSVDLGRPLGIEEVLQLITCATEEVCPGEALTDKLEELGVAHFTQELGLNLVAWRECLLS